MRGWILAPLFFLIAGNLPDQEARARSTNDRSMKYRQAPNNAIF